MDIEFIGFFSILYSSIIFTQTHNLVRHDKYYYESITRVYSTIHAMTSFCIALYYLYFPTNLIYSLLFSNSFVYICLDSVFVYYYKDKIQNDFSLWFHHALFAIGLSIVTYSYPNLYRYIARCLITELSTPFLNWSWKMYKYPYYNSWTIHEELIAHSCLLVTFFISRPVNLFFLIYNFSNLYQNIIPYIFLLSLFVLNCNWFYLLFSKFISSIR
mgnify:CR=1 FL=1